MDFEYDEIDKKHAQILEEVCVMNRSNKSGFKEGKTDRLNAIRELLKASGYTEILLPHAQIWRKNMDAPIDMIVSSHADVVDSISKCFSELTDDGYLCGTYDNAGTNAAAVIAMLEGNIPDNVIFAFTADEETGRCNGARQTLEYARNQGYEPVCMALDVTWEGYDDGNLFSVENLSSGYKKNEDISFLNRVADAAVNMEPEGIRTFSFVRINKNTAPDKNSLPDYYISKDTGMFDEAFAYVREHARGFSLCLPCNGGMHSNHGVTVRQPGFEGYVNALKTMCYQLSLPEEKNMADRVPESVRIENKVLSERICGLIREEEEKEKQRRAALSSEKTYSSYSYVSDNWDGYSYYGYEDDDTYGGYDPDDPLSWVIDTLYEGCVDYRPEEKQNYIDAALEYIDSIQDDDGNNPVFERYDREAIISLLNDIFNDYLAANGEWEEYEFDPPGSSKEPDYADYMAYDVSDDFDDLDYDDFD